MKISFAVGFAPGHPREFGDCCKTAEECGFEKIGVVDSQSIYREVYLSCAVAARSTSQILFGPRVTNPVTRHATTTASALLTLNELAPGRVFAGVGTGDSALANIGMRPVKLAALGEFVVTLQKLLQGESVEQAGAHLQLTWGKAHVPIYMAAHGPKSLELAGAVADGVIIGTGVGKELVRDALDALRRGAAQSGRSLESLDIWWHLGAHMAESRDEASAAIRFNLASKVNHLLRGHNREKYLPPESLDELEKIHRGYNYHEHLSPGGSGVNARLVRDSGVEAYLADRYAIVGSGADCLARLEELRTLGVAKIWLNTYSDDKLGFMRRWNKEVIAKLA
jgi:5,10-methylenetetrahydromethanopterin reductase